MIHSSIHYRHFIHHHHHLSIPHPSIIHPFSNNQAIHSSSSIHSFINHHKNHIPSFFHHLFIQLQSIHQLIYCHYRRPTIHAPFTNIHPFIHHPSKNHIPPFFDYHPLFIQSPSNSSIIIIINHPSILHSSTSANPSIILHPSIYPSFHSRKKRICSLHIKTFSVELLLLSSTNICSFFLN